MLFKILQGPSSRISTETTPLHEGYAYFTPDTAGFYIDAQVNGVLTRVQVNPDQVLQAVRNETTYQDIASATERGCAVLCVDGSVVYQLANLNTSTKTALFISMYEVDSDSVAHIRAWTVMEEDDGTTTWERHSKVTTEAVVEAVTEQNTSADQKFWRGTQAEYDAIEDKDDSVLYIVTDEDEGSAIVVGDMKAEFYDADLEVKEAGGIAAFVQAKVNGVTVSSLGAAAADHTHTASEVGAIPASQKGAANGVASLGSDGKVPNEQLPTTSVDAYTKAETLTDETAALYGLGTGAVPDEVFAKIATSPFGWKLIKAYKTAGSYIFTVPDVIAEIGVYMIGGGGGGGGNTTTSGAYFYASGGAGGYGKNLLLDVTPGQKIPVVVGAGGAGANSNNTSGTSGSAGGTTSFNGETVSGGGGGEATRGSAPAGAVGGQGSTPARTNITTTVKLYGSRPTPEDTYGYYTYTAQTEKEAQNLFDETMVSLCAGGSAFAYGNPSATNVIQSMVAMPDGTKGGDGIAGTGESGGNDATGNGNGGGAFVSSTYCVSGAGSDGAVYIYARSASA